MVERFTDCRISADTLVDPRDWMDCQIQWRGGMRRGRIHWLADEADEIMPSLPAPVGDGIDWEVFIDIDGSTPIPWR